MKTTRPARRGYTAAVVIIIVAAVIRAAIGTLGVRIPFVTFYPAVMIAGIYGGMRAGLLATGLSAFLAATFWMEPIGKPWVTHPGDWIILSTFITTCILLSYTAELMYRAQARAKEAEARLEIAAEREKAMAALRESEEQFRNLAETMPAVVFFTRQDGSVEYFNRQWTEYTGMALEQSTGNLWTAALHPDDCRRTLARWERSLKTGEPFEIEYRFKRAEDSGYHWFLGRALPIHNRAGQIVRWFGTCTYIHDQKQIEMALRQSEEKLRLALDAAQMGTWDWNILTGELVWSDRCRGLFAVGPDEPVFYDRFIEALYPEDRERIGLAVREAIEKNKTYDAEMRALWPDGTLHWVMAKGRAYYDAEGNATRMNGVVLDITERKRIEEELCDSRNSLELRVQERTAELEKANSILMDQAALLDLAHDAILVRDMHSTITFWNNGATETYGFTRDEAIGKITHELLQTSFSEPMNRIMQHVLQDQRWAGELRHTTSAGKEITVESRWALKSDVDGNPLGFLEINRDITDRKKAEEALKSNMARLETINSELQEFAFVASHDLQEPLRKIQTFGNMLKDKCATELDGREQGYLDKMLTSAGRMRQLLDDLLQYSRVATISGPFKGVDLGKIAREAADIFEQQIKGTGAEINIQDLPIIEAEESQMLRLFQNLIGNALRFRSDLNPLIEVYAQCDGGKWCDIFIKDNGIGFEQQFAERIFKPFQRLHGRNEYEGTGMGLAICRKIVERHGGNIKAKSEPGKGSTVVVKLPVKQAVSQST